MNVVFRADASVAIGTGHVMRCRTLASALLNKGAKVHFVTRAHVGHLGELLARDGFPVTLLPPPVAGACNRDDYAAWLGVTQQEDADQTITAVDKQQCDWLVVDHYALDELWEARLRPHTRKLMVIDDLADRPHNCDMLLDQNYAAGGRERYRAWVPAHCQLLLGPRYALLSQEFAEYRKKLFTRADSVRSILVFMGGSDNANVTGKILAALSVEQLLHLEVDVVIGQNFIHKDPVAAQANARPNTRIHGPRPHLADLMLNADLAIGAGGTTTWERMCMGLPSLVISAAENQVPICEALDSSGLIRYLGPATHLDSSAIRGAIVEFLADTKLRRTLATHNRALVDGRGVDRVTEMVCPSERTNLRLRPATPSDALTYFSWANDPKVRSSAINTDPIELEAHLEWFSGRLLDAKCRLFVLEAGDLPVGQIRFESHGGRSTIDYSLDVFVRGRGWGKELVRLGIDAINAIEPTTLTATVRPENDVSSATFIRVGFVEQGRDGAGNRCFLLPLPKSNDRNCLASGWQ